MPRSKFRTESNIREAVAGESVGDYMLKDYHDWSGPDEMAEQTSRMEGLAERKPPKKLLDTVALTWPT